VRIDLAVAAECVCRVTASVGNQQASGSGILSVLLAAAAGAVHLAVVSKNIAPRAGKMLQSAPLRLQAPRRRKRQSIK